LRRSQKVAPRSAAIDDWTMSTVAAATMIAGDWPMIEAQLPSTWRELAQQHGAVPARRPVELGAKVTDAAVPLRMVLHHIGTNTSLKTTAAMAAAAGLIDVSAVSLHKWMEKFAPFLESLLLALTGAAQQFAAPCWAGYDIFLVDATAVSRPGSKGLTGRVHYALRLSSLRPVQIDVTDHRGGETLRRFHRNVGPGQLWIGDRGYANPPGIASVVNKGAAVLIRINRGSLPLYDEGGALLDVGEKLADHMTHVGVPREWPAWVKPEHGERIRGRICAVRLPPDKAEEARARLRRENGNKVSAESLEMANFVAVFTTVPQDRLATARVLELYALRWQVELSIKRDKSIAGLDRLPNFRNDTIRSWILGKMLLTQIAHKIATPDVAVPPCAA
jgi:hypothetical protein